MPDPLKKNREKFYYNKTGIDIQNPVTPERSYEIPFELKRSVPTHISREVLLHITGFTSDQRIEQKFSFLMTDKASVKKLFSKIKKTFRGEHPARCLRSRSRVGQAPAEGCAICM